MKHNTNHLPAFPTFPITDKLGQVNIFFGCSKLEMGAFIIASGLSTNIQKLEPEAVADLSIEIAQYIISKCDQKLTEDSNNISSSQIIK
jgi:hypothetical protein